jgi:hypothetical protein
LAACSRSFSTADWFDDARRDAASEVFLPTVLTRAHLLQQEVQLVAHGSPAAPRQRVGCDCRRSALGHVVLVGQQRDPRSSAGPRHRA